MTDGGEARERAVEHVTRRSTFRVRNEADAAGIALAPRVVDGA
jgi:hypothetical protein